MKKTIVRHSELFRDIASRPDAYAAIRTFTHSQPLLVFWITPDCVVLDAHDAHHDNPPHGDRSILAHRTHKGHLRGRAAFIGDVLYIVLYGDAAGKKWTKQQHRHIAQALPMLKEALALRGIDREVIKQAVLIDEWGR